MNFTIWVDLQICISVPLIKQSKIKIKKGSISRSREKTYQNVENVKIRYGKGTAGVFYCSEIENKARPEFSSIEILEIRYCWGFILF